jgi:hypothetical protein
MPTRKQRRRREKLQRHEYEYVIETEEGEEIPVERPPARVEPKDGAKGRSGERELRDRRGRVVPKPSWQRTMKRGLVFLPFLVLIMFLIGGKNASPAVLILNAVFLLAIFIPFSYMVDTFMYRAFQKRAARRS